MEMGKSRNVKGGPMDHILKWIGCWGKGQRDLRDDSQVSGLASWGYGY